MSEIKRQTINIAPDDPTSNAPDPFDLSNLRLPQEFAETAGVKKLLKTVPVHKPNPQDFVHLCIQSMNSVKIFPVVELKDGNGR